MYIYKYFVAFMHSLVLHLCMCVCCILCTWICTCVYATRVTKKERKHGSCRSLSHKLQCHLSQYSMI